MNARLTRRDLLKIAGGSAVGLMVSPLPWKLLDDTAIWTQNWERTPKLPAGLIGTLTSSCPLCPTGCAVQVRTVGGIPTTIKGIAADPVSRGALCPNGLAGHHLAYHPLRPNSPLVGEGMSVLGRMTPTSYEEAYRRVGEAAGRLSTRSLRGSVVVVGSSPNQAATSAWESFLRSFPDGKFVVPTAGDDRTLTILRRLAAVDPGPLGFALTQTKTILSFGAPVLDGWHGYGPLRLKRQSGNGLRVIQVETLPSRTALAADRWLQVKPGTEGLLALGIGQLLITSSVAAAKNAQHIHDRAELESTLRGVSLEQIAFATGISVDALRQTAAEILEGPSCSIAGCDPGGGPLPEQTERIIAGLNLLVGNPSARGGIVPSMSLPGSTGTRPVLFDEIPDHSVALLILDGSESGYAIPSDVVRRKLIPGDGMLVALTPILTPLAASADILIPVAAPYEVLTDVVAQGLNGAALVGLTPPLHHPAVSRPDAFEVIQQIARSGGCAVPEVMTAADAIDRRISAIMQSRRGSVVAPATGIEVRLTSLSGPEDLKTRLMRGERWMDSPAPPRSTPEYTVGCSSPGILNECPAEPTDRRSVAVMPFGVRIAHATGIVSPMLSKVFQETGLRELDGIALLNPGTARELGLASGESASLRTPHGSRSVSIRLMSSVLPGVAHVSVGPRPNGAEQSGEDCIEGIFGLTAIGDSGRWRLIPATIDGGSIHG